MSIKIMGVETKEEYSILIMDDAPIVRAGLAALINQEKMLTICAEASTPEEAIEFLQTLKPDIAVIELALGSALGGIHFITEARSSSPNTRILVLSYLPEEFYADRCMRAGARGYLMKGVATHIIIQSLRDILDGKTVLSDKVKEQVFLSPKAHQENISLPEILSDRELEVFRLIGLGLGTSEIALKLDLSVKTIEAYKENTKRKLSLKNSSELTQFAVHWNAHSKKSN